MTTISEVTGLSKLDVKALRQCDRVHVSTIGGFTTVRCIKEIEASKRKPFEDSSREHSFSADASMTDYSDSASGGRRDIVHYNCRELLSNYQFEVTPFSTVVRLLRAGDRLVFHWIRSNDSENIRRAGLNCDQLEIIVNRGKGRLCFLVASQVCPDNTARMTRRA